MDINIEAAAGTASDGFALPPECRLSPEEQVVLPGNRRGEPQTQRGEPNWALLSQHLPSELQPR